MFVLERAIVERKKEILHFLRGAEWMTRHEHEHRVVWIDYHRHLGPIPFLSQYAATADLTAKAQKLPLPHLSAASAPRAGTVPAG